MLGLSRGCAARVTQGSAGSHAIALAAGRPIGDQVQVGSLDSVQNSYIVREEQL